MATFDAGDIGAVLQGVGALAQAFAIGFAAWLASNTYSSWRTQKLSERRIEQAERILTAAYKVRRALQHLRSPVLWAHELQSAEKTLKDRDLWPDVEDQQSRLVTVQAYYSRLDLCFDDRVALEACQPMARALFNEDLEKAIEGLNRHFHMVRVQVDSMSRTWGKSTPEQINRQDDAMYSGAGDNEYPNKMDQEIIGQIETIEGILLPILRLRSNAS